MMVVSDSEEDVVIVVEGEGEGQVKGGRKKVRLGWN